jgi:PKD repeat protein
MIPAWRRHIVGPSVLAIVLAFLAVTLLALVFTPGEGEAAANLYIDSSDIVPDVPEPTKGTTSEVVVTVNNGGDANATGFYVKLRDLTAAEDLGKVGPFNLTANNSLSATFSWDLTGASTGKHTLRAFADPDGNVEESSEEDNTADLDVNINLPPEAKASASTTSAQTLTSISFSATGSNDPDGTIKAYLWYFGDGAVASGFNVTHAYGDGSPTPGKSYNVTLVVSDNDGGVGKHTLTLRILNRRPTAAANGATIKTMTPTSISGDASTDLDGKIIRYEWSLHNGTVLHGSPAVVSYGDDGSYGIVLTVWDDDGVQDSVSITMVALNQAPVVKMEANRTLVGTGDSIHFDATDSSDIDGVITNYTWIFGDRTTSTGKSVDHAYVINGSYNVTLVLVDDDGAISFDTLRVIVGNSPPVAVARANLGYVLTFEDVELNGTSSIDPDDNIATYAWDFGDGYSATGEVVTHNYSDDGVYDVTLTVTDTGGAFGTNVVSVTVGNRPPIASFPDLSVMTGEPARFHGGPSSDRDGYLESFLWDLSGGLVYSTANASHVWDRPGVYTVTLTVWDDDGASDETTFNVTVNNRSPIAVISASPLKTTLAHPVTFNGTNSVDPDGEIVNWTWIFGDGVRDYGEEVSHTYTVYGTYLATLTVRDDSGGINTSSVLITVRNQPPVAIMNVTPVSALTGEVVTFDGRNSSDPENQIAEYFWSFGDGDSATGAIVTHTYSDDGRYIVRLTVVDEDDTASYVELPVTIYNKLPKAMAEATPLEAMTLVDVTFKGTGSHDDDGHLLWYRWDFGDGTVAYGETVTHAFLDDGTYTVVLTVTDDDGSEADTSVDVTITNRDPFAVAGLDLTTRTGIPVRLDGRASYDPDGDVVLYEWDFGDGDVATGPVVTHSFPTFGSFEVRLTITDDDGATATGNLTVKVENVQPVARASGDLKVLSGEEVKMDGTGSYDLDGNIVEYLWDMGDGKTELGPIVRHTYTGVGTFIVTLTVEDEGGLKSSIELVVEVMNRRPTASLSASGTNLPTGETLELDASSSSDEDGTVVAYTWIFGDGAVAHGARVNHVYNDDGIYMVVLTVTDNGGGTDSTSQFIQVENRPPLPAMEAIEETLTLVQVDFTAEGTMDPDGTAVGFFWDFGDGDGEDGWSVNHTYTTSGSYTVRLTVMDDDGRTSSTNMTLTIVNRPPVAVAESIGTAYVNTTVKFDASDSNDLDGLISSWEWDFGDGYTGDGREAYHRYTEAGTYTWSLSVLDDKGENHTATGSIVINERPFVPPDDGTGTDGGKDDSLLPGPSALMAIAVMVVTSIALASRRRER